MGGPDPAVAAVRHAVRSALADLPETAAVLVACSGGADSLALAAATAFCRPRAGLLTVDHDLQPGSADQAERVAAWARERGLAPVEVLRVAVGREGGPEAAARTARYAALEEAARRHGAAAVLLGHTLDDQAETVLLGLARGSGARSLAGMPAVRDVFRRPLLGLTRATTRAACAAEGLTPWEDPHNDDPAFTRVRIRRVLGELERAAPGTTVGLARTARLLRADADALDELAERAAADCRTGDALDCGRLAALPAALRTRVLRAAALAAGAPRGALSSAHVEALDALVVGWSGQGPVCLPGGVSGFRRSGTLHMTRRHEGKDAARPARDDAGVARVRQ